MLTYQAISALLWMGYPEIVVLPVCLTHEVTRIPWLMLPGSGLFSTLEEFFIIIVSSSLSLGRSMLGFLSHYWNYMLVVRLGYKYIEVYRSTYKYIGLNSTISLMYLAECLKTVNWKSLWQWSRPAVERPWRVLA